MEHENKRSLRLVRFAFGLAAMAATGGAFAQVTPVEPFGGRPFGSDQAPAPQPRAPQPMVVQPGAAPVLVQPGGGPVVVQPPQAQVPVQPPQPQPQVQAQPQPQPQQGMAGPSGRPPSSVNPQAANGTRPNVQQQDQASDSAAPPIVNPPSPVPAPVTPPFAANRALGTAGAAAAAPAQQQAVRGLPADAPRLVISGSVYSPDANRRMLIVNGQVFREGADLGSGVVLQEVRPDSAVLGFKGGRYNVFF
jgi:general secretion pathway protein B